MSIDITLPDTRFTLFENINWANSHNLNYLYSKHNNLKVDSSNNLLYISPNQTITNDEYDSILIKDSPDLYINRYETLIISYQFKDYKDIGFKLYVKNSESNLIALTNIIPITSKLNDFLPIKYFTQDFNTEGILVFAIEFTSADSYVIIQNLEIKAFEGDKMIYESEKVIDTYSQIEHSIYENITNLYEYPYGPNGLDPSGINQIYYRNIPNLDTSSKILLTKEFTNIDYPNYDNLPAYTNALIDYNKNVQYNINMSVPQGYIYLLQFILNDITFTSNPSLELTGIYGNFNTSTYFSEGDTYDQICASGSTYATPILGKNIKLHIPDISDKVIDERNNKNYILKKINILFMKFHNAMFDFMYNYVDYSGNHLGDSPFVQNYFVPPILSSGLNAKVIFEIIRRHTILHYQSLLINDVISRFVDPIDLAHYYKTDNINCSTSTTDTDQISIEFLEILRMLSNLDQNQNQLYIDGPNDINKYSLYDSNNYDIYESSGITVSGINWGNFFKCSEKSPFYSKKISPIINYSDINGSSISNVSISNIIENNPYFYFSNTRLENNTIASGQTIRKNITDYNNNKLCDINTSLFKSYDLSGLLLSNDLLNYTPLITYILYESDIFNQGSQLAQNGVGSNIFLRNFFKVMYSSIIDYTDLYINTSPILFDFINNSVDNSGNIRAGRVDNNNIVRTINGIYMRDIIRASNTNYLNNSTIVTDYSGNCQTISGSQQYYIFSINNFFDINVQKYIEVIQTETETPTALNFYIGEDDYLKLYSFTNKLYVKYDNNTYYYIDNGKINGTLGISYYITLGFNPSTPLLKNKKITLLMFSHM